jgi:predicted amidohydrolase
VSSFPTVRVAAVQATPVMLDGDACVELAVERMRAAAAEGAQLSCCPSASSPSTPSRG